MYTNNLYTLYILPASVTTASAWGPNTKRVEVRVLADMLNGGWKGGGISY